MDPSAWKLVTIDRGGESKYLEASVEGLLDNQVVTDLLLKKMVVRVVTMELREVIEEATFQSHQNGYSFRFKPYSSLCHFSFQMHFSDMLS